MRRDAILLATSLVALVACSSPPANPPAAAPKPAPATKPAPAAAPAASAATAEAPSFVYAYIPSGKRDPFRNPLEDLASSERAGALVSSACTAPLCRWDLDQLKLVGVVSGMSNPLAMVEDPHGVGYMVRRNSFMGKKGGRVTQIKHDTVVVTEIVRGGDGKPHPNEIPLHLKVEATASGDQDLLQNEGGSE